MTKLTHRVEIHSPVEKVYDLARQVEKYPEFLPGYVESRIVQQRESGALLERAALIRGEMVRWTSEVGWRENEAIHFVSKGGSAARDDGELAICSPFPRIRLN